MRLCECESELRLRLCECESEIVCVIEWLSVSQGRWKAETERQRAQRRVRES